MSHRSDCAQSAIFATYQSAAAPFYTHATFMYLLIANNGYPILVASSTASDPTSLHDESRFLNRTTDNPESCFLFDALVFELPSAMAMRLAS